MKIRWTKAALRDLEDLHSFIAGDDPQAADRVVEAILQGLEAACRFPESGRQGTRLTGTRELVLAPFLVVYRIKSAALEVVAVIHGARKSV